MDQTKNHPLYPEREYIAVCAECGSEKVRKIEGRDWCYDCDQREMLEVLGYNNNLDYKIKEAKYKGSSFAVNYKPRDYWYD